MLLTDEFKARLPQLMAQADTTVHVKTETDHVRLDGSVFPVGAALDGLAEDGVRQRQGQVMHAARVRRGPGRIGLAALGGEDRDQAPSLGSK